MKLAGLFARRILFSLALVLLVPAVIFSLVALTPGSIAQRLLGDAPPEAVRQLELRLGLDQPVYVQYVNWLSGTIRGDFGKSYATGEPVVAVLGQHMSVTTYAIVGALLLSALIGIPLGFAGAYLKGRFSSGVINVLSVLGLAVPSFVIAIVIVDIFAVDLRLFPATGYVELGRSPGDWARSLVLPVVALSSTLVTAVAKQTRDQMKAVTHSDFVKSLRARGISRPSIVGKHVFRNALIPVVTVIGVNMVPAIGGTVFVEKVFALPGIGASLHRAVSTGDVPVALGCAFYFTVMIILVNVLVDLAYVVLDPRLRANGVA